VKELGLGVKVGNCNVQPSSFVKKPWRFLDPSLTMEKDVTNVSRVCHFHLRNISRIKHYLSDVACRSLVQATVASRHANSLRLGITETQMKRLQRVQNSAGATGDRCNSITPILQDLHWLPVHVTYTLILKFCC
jgi:uncharacterized cysteine cluster protein YcgN (CxxCxxCC family)